MLKRLAQLTTLLLALMAFAAPALTRAQAPAQLARDVRLIMEA